MSKLLYHRPRQSSAVSPFDEAVLAVSRHGPLRIACPYIGTAYLLRVLGMSDDWRLISDVQEWLTVLPRLARPKAWQFIREHLDRIHHFQDLHAKVVIGGHAAMFGSANLTHRGILGRAEMGMLLDNPAHISELVAWFDALWEETTPLAVDEGNAFIQWLDEQAEQSPARRQQFVFSNQGRRVRAKLVKLAREEPQGHEDDAPLSLGVVAQELVAAEETHFDSVEDAFEAALEALSDSGTFTLRDAVTAVRSLFAGAVVREVYALVLRHCANHPRSVFAEGTLNRLLLKDGAFAQSSRETLMPALAPFDRFLLALVNLLEFGVARGLPLEDVLEREVGIPGRDQVWLVAGLLDVGLLVLEDVPGELPHYRLERGYEWDGRFRLFTRAHAAWRAKADKATAAPALRSQEDIEDDEERWAHHVSDDSLPDAVDESDGSFTFDAIAQAMVQGERKLERRHAIDAWLAQVVGLMVGGERFEGADFMAVVEAAAGVSGVDKTLADGVLSPTGEGPPVFSVAQRDGGLRWALDINPALTWNMLKKYPKTKAACKALLAKG